MFQLNIRFIVKMLGSMLMLETFFMLSAALVSFFYKENDLYPILLSAGIMGGCGVLLYMLGFHANEHNAGKREGLLTVSLIWVLLSFFGMLPYYLGGYIPTITNAFFETMSGYTTTGSTILIDIEALPHGILFWRSLTQWQGGIGVIVFTVALLPLFGVGATQLYDAETTGVTHDRFRPRVTQVAKRLWGVYFFLTALLVLLLWVGPMSLFDSVCHSLTCMATGGYSTKNASIAYWNSAYVEYVLSLFMFIASINFTLLFFFLKGNPKRLLKDEEFRWFFFFVLSMIVVVTGWLMIKGIVPDLISAVRQACFQVVTLVSTTGYAVSDYNLWGSFFWLIALILMFICGCGGSTCGGIKMGRFVILVKNLSNEFKKQTHPHAVIPVRMNKHVVSVSIVQRVMAFLFVYIGVIVFGCLILMADNVGFPESIGAVVSAIGNNGPGLGAVGPVNNFSALPDLSKWVLALIMMVGRLEIFTVLTIFLPGFWKQ